jgi:flagellar biosynthesis regulator FlaF
MPAVVVKTASPLSAGLPISEAMARLGLSEVVAHAGGETLTQEDLLAISEIQQADDHRRHRANKHIFQNIRARMEYRRVVAMVASSAAATQDHREAITLFVADMWKKWLEMWNAQRAQLVQERDANMGSLEGIFVAKARASAALAAATAGHTHEGGQHDHDGERRSPGRRRRDHMKEASSLEAVHGDSSHHFTAAIGDMSPPNTSATFKW